MTELKFKKELNFSLFTTESQATLKPLICPLCHGVLNKPVIDKCGHNFCKSCIVKLLNEDQKCPINASNLHYIDLKPNKDIENIINSQECYCHFKENGCQWKGLFLHLPNHSCEFNSIKTFKNTNEETTDPKTKKVYVRCKNNCFCLIEKEMLEIHYNEHCPYEIIKCSHKSCDCGQMFPRIEYNEHLLKKINKIVKSSKNNLFLTQLQVDHVHCMIEGLKDRLNKMSNVLGGNKEQMHLIAIEDDNKNQNVFVEEEKNALHTGNKTPSLNNFSIELKNNVFLNKKTKNNNDFELIFGLNDETAEEKNDKSNYITNIQDIYEVDHIKNLVQINGKRIKSLSEKKVMILGACKLTNHSIFEVKIIKHNNLIGIGICNQRKAIENFYQFSPNSTNDHGTFLITNSKSNSVSRQYNFSLSKEDNIVTDFEINEGDSIRVELFKEQKKIKFLNKDRIVVLNEVHYPEKGQLIPCFILSKDDEISLRYLKNN